MSESNRAKWIEVLETIALKRPDEAEQEWAWVMEHLELGPEYFLAIHEAVRQGGWREAENPAGYIKKVAQREKRQEGADGSRGRRGARGFRGFQALEAKGEEMTLGRGGSMEMEGERFSSEEMLDHLQYRQESGKPMPEEDRVWRSAPGLESDHEGMLRPTGGKPRRGRAKGTMKGPGPLLRYAERIERMRREAGMDERDEPYKEEGPERLPDWPKMAAEAGLSDWEQKVVEYKMSGVGWTEAMAAQPDEASRRALQAAWRKLDRTGERLREAAQTQSLGNAEETE